MRGIKSIRELAFTGRAVLMRLDLNVPIKGGKVTSDARIRASLPTIRYAMEAGARIALASHLGRPKGKRAPEDSLEPVGARLSDLLGTEVIFAEDCIGDGVKRLVHELRPGSVMLLENLRFHAGEEKNEPGFAKDLAAPFDLYVNDAFGSSHRAHASIVGVLHHIKDRAAGLLLEAEVTALTKLLEETKKPFVALVGGAKVADKVGVLDALLRRVNTLCIGGAMAYTFLKARGVMVGASRVEADKIHIATDILKRAKDRGVELLLPVDHVAGKTFEATTTPQMIAGETIPEASIGLDIGPKTREKFAEKVRGAATLFWNGPMGVFEWDNFAKGTLGVAQAVAECQGYTVVGGGDSVAALEKAGVVDRIKHVSTGGGASLEFIELGTLPGLEALRGKI